MAQKTESTKRPSLKLAGWRLWLAVAVAILATGAAVFYAISCLRSSQQLSSSSAATKLPKIVAIAALGRLAPEGEVIHLSAPTSLEAVQVAQLLVKEGDKVRAGQLVAILDGRDRLLAALEQAKKQVKVFEARLAQVKAGAKAGDIDARSSAIARLEAELSNARIEYQRYQLLYQNGAISASLLDSKRLSVDTIDAQLQQAKANLNSTAEVRVVDVQVAQAELENAMAQVAKAQADLQLAYVRAPASGEILAIHTHAGEALGKQGIVDLGRTDRMIVVAEINQDRIAKVKLGQRATITSSVFSSELQGTVSQLGSQIGKQDIFGTDPAAAADARVVEVKIRLNRADSQKVSKFTNLQVDVAIHI